MIVWLLLAVTGVAGAAPERKRLLSREARLQYSSTIAASVLSRTPPGARLIDIRGDVPPLVDRLIHNATSIHSDIVDTFNCSGRVYGYYADPDNKCKIFHICVPMQQLFPDLYDAEDIFHFSFICPGYTIFSQDSMTCNWEDWAFPCTMASQLYHRNNHFFVVPAEDVQRTPPPPPPSSSPTPASRGLRLTLTSSPSPDPPDHHLSTSTTLLPLRRGSTLSTTTTRAPPPRVPAPRRRTSALTHNPNTSSRVASRRGRFTYSS